MPWPARRRLLERIRAPRPPVDIAALARQIEARTEPDSHAAEHVATLLHYTATPRKRTA
jgi:hypothetical protein